MFSQRTFEDLGSPLAAVTFCVVDLETTGGSPASSAITEIGALKVRRGETLGSFHTLVNPGVPVPVSIRFLTGIRDEMLVEAPPIEAVLPSLLEFLGGSVVVAHNARFDVSFLNAALHRSGYEPLGNMVVDTARLARKILRGEVPDNRLETLSRHLRCAHHPRHRAYADVLATTDLLHCLIERVAGFGITTLEELIAVSSTRLDGTFHKISLARGLPRGPGVYRFVGATGRTLYVGKAADLRSRVRSYFYDDPRRRIGNLLRETAEVRAETHGSILEAEVAEARAIAHESPPYNRAGKGRASWYLKVTVTARVPKLATARVKREDGSAYVGPVASARAARALMEAVRDALPVHRCREPAACRGCAFGEMRACVGPDMELHRQQMRIAATGLLCDPGGLLDRLARRIGHLAALHRFEEAARVREQAAHLEQTLTRAAEVRALCDARDIVLSNHARAWLIRNGRLAAAADYEDDSKTTTRLREVASADSPPPSPREASVIASWLRRTAEDLRLVHVSGAWALPAGARPGRFRSGS